MGNKVSQCFFSFPLFVCVFVRVCASSLEYVSLAVFANYMWPLKSFKEAEHCVLSSLVLMLYIQKIFHCLPYLLYRLNLSSSLQQGVVRELWDERICEM